MGARLKRLLGTLGAAVALGLWTPYVSADAPEPFAVMADTDEGLPVSVLEQPKVDFFSALPESERAGKAFLASVVDANLPLNRLSANPASQLDQEVRAFSAQGEYVYRRLAVRTYKALGTFKGTLSALRTDDGKELAAENLRLAYLANEFLVKSELANVPANSLLSFLLLLNAPVNAEPGLYKGEFTLGDESSSASFAVSFRILPLKLPELSISMGVYLPGHPSGLGAEWGQKWAAPTYTKERLNDYFRFWATRRFNSPTLFHLTPTAHREGPDFKLDFSVPDAVVDAMRANGLTGYLILDLRFYADWAHAVSNVKVFGGLSGLEIYRKALEQLVAHAKEKGYGPWLCLQEEEIANGGDKTERYERHWRLLREVVGPDHDLILDNDLGYGRKDAVDRGARDGFRRRQYNSWEEGALAKAKADNAEVWLYNYGFDRLSYGFLQLALGSKGYHQWADQWFIPPYLYSRITPTGIVSSLSFEEAHEGINDYRYAQLVKDGATLSALVPKLPCEGPAATTLAAAYPSARLDLLRWKAVLASNPTLGAASSKGTPSISLSPSETVEIEVKGDKLLKAAKLPEDLALDGQVEPPWGQTGNTGALRPLLSTERALQAQAASKEDYEQALAKFSYATSAVGFNKDGLLLLVEANHSDPSQVKDFGNNDGNLWRGDCFEFFFQLPGPRGTYHLIANARGNLTWLADGKALEVSGIRTGTRSPINGSGGYAQELLIPWRFFGLDAPPLADTLWRYNVGREFHSFNQLTTWSPVEAGFEEVSNWGFLSFSAGKGGRYLKEMPAPALRAGLNVLAGTLTQTALDEKVSLAAVDEDGKALALLTPTGASFSLEVQLPPSARTRALRLEVHKDGKTLETEVWQCQGSETAVSSGATEALEWFTGTDLPVPVLVNLADATAKGSPLLVRFLGKDGKELARASTPAVSGGKQVVHLLTAGLPAGSYTLDFSFPMAPPFAKSLQVPLRLLPTPYSEDNPWRGKGEIGP